MSCPRRFRPRPPPRYNRGMSFQTVSTTFHWALFSPPCVGWLKQLSINRVASTNQSEAIKAVEESNALNRELLESNR